jgi:DNA-binding transcriptional MerR regulator/methylmalonyl-CoA mutase cobalamin-binding subunit
MAVGRGAGSFVGPGVVVLVPDMNAQGPYKMGTITGMTGLSSSLLRAWERRYGLLRPKRGRGGHRLYTDDDLRVLETIQLLIAEGRSIGEIAALGREAILDRSTSTRGREDSGPEPAGPDRLERLRDEVVQAALDLDSDRLNQVLDRVATTVSFATLIERVIEPSAREIGDLWESGECSVASEHLASSIFVYRLRRLIESAESFPGRNARFAIAACLPGEEHQLGLLVVSYFLNRNGVRVLYLGASLPFDDLRHACWASRPQAVLLSVTRKATFRRHREGILTLTGDINHSTRLYMGGTGAPECDEELQSVGVVLVPSVESPQDAARRIAGELVSGK